MNCKFLPHTLGPGEEEDTKASSSSGFMEKWMSLGDSWKMTGRRRLLGQGRQFTYTVASK